MGHEERVDVAEHRAQRGPPTSQNVWHRYIPRVPSPRKPSRSRMRSAASTASGPTPSCAACLRSSSGLPKYVRRRPCAAGRRSGCRSAAPHAVLELARDRAVLLGGEPAGERGGHRVVRGDERDAVERAVAQLDVAVARVRPRRRGRRAARAEEGGDDGDRESARGERDQAATRRDRPPGVGAGGGAPPRRRRVSAGGRSSRSSAFTRCRSGGRPRASRRARRPRRARGARRRPAATRATARRARRGGVGCSAVAWSARRRRRSPSSIGRRTDVAAAVTIAPQPARIHAADRRSPRKASQIAPAAARASAPWTSRTATARAMPSSTTTAMPAHAAPTPSSATVRRRSGDAHSAPAARARQRSGEDDREDAERPRGVRDRGAEGRPWRLEDRRRGRSASAAAPATAAAAQRGASTVPTSATVSVTVSSSRVEDGAVHVAHGGAEQGRERAPADDARPRRLDQRPRGEQVGLVREHDLVGDPVGDERADAARRAARPWRGWRTGPSRRARGGRSRRPARGRARAWRARPGRAR